MSRYYRTILNVQATAIDPDAQAFLTAAGIVDATITSAINNLVVGLKSAGLWAKMKAIYPFVGGTATTHKFNLKDPRDLDVAYRITWFGGVTHDANGVQGNGTNGYANTHLKVNDLNQDSNFVGWYSRTEGDQSTVEYGARITANQNSFFTLSRAIGGTASLRNNVSTSSLIPLNTISSGFLGQGRTSNSSIFFRRRDSVNVLVSNRTFTPSSLDIFLMALNDVPALFFSTRQFTFFCFAEDISSADSDNIKTAVDTFQTTLSRNV